MFWLAKICEMNECLFKAYGVCHEGKSAGSLETSLCPWGPYARGKTNIETLLSLSYFMGGEGENLTIFLHNEVAIGIGVVGWDLLLWFLWIF